MSHGGHHPVVSSFVVVQSGGIAEAFGERVGVDFELCDELVLVGRDCGEDGLWEDVGVVALVNELRRRRRRGDAVAAND